MLNFFLGGTGVGFYILLFFFDQGLKNGAGVNGTLLPKLIAPALVTAGLLFVAMEAGQPFRGLYVFINVKHSWMSREIVFATIFIIFSLFELTIDSRALSFLAATVGVLFVGSQAMILYRSYAVPAWIGPTIPLLFVSSALLHGFALSLLPPIVHVYPVKIDVLLYGMSCILSTMAIWVGWIYAKKNKETMRARQILRSTRMLITGVGAGGLLPLFVLAGTVLKSDTPEGPLVTVWYALCGAAILSSGIYRLYRMVYWVDYLRPVLVDKTS